MMSGGQTFNDRLTAARHSIAGQGLAKSVCKSTTEEVIGPKKKHLDYLLHCTNEPNVSIPQLANLLIERTQNSSWVVVFKALITVHHLMCYGNERFTQYLASSNCSFQLGNFLDKSGVQGYDMSTFIRRYAKYLNEKALSYRTVAFDFCKGKRGKEDGVLRTMNADKLLKTLPVLQNQIDALLEFDCTANELGNGVINSAFMLLFRDLIRLFACYNDGIINLLEKYFDMNKKMCREALDIYKKFLIRMDRVAEFLKVAESMGIEKHEIPDISENVGIDKGDIPDLAKMGTAADEEAEVIDQFVECGATAAFQIMCQAPSSLLDALEQHLASLEGRKGSGAGTPTQPSGQPAYFKSAVTALSSTSNSFGSAAAATTGREVNGTPMDESLKKQVLEEEQAVLNQHKVMKENERRLKELAAQSPTGPSTGSTSTNPFLTSPTAQPNQQPVIDLFGSPPASTTTPTTATGKSSDDLLCLTSNPFAESIINNSQPATGSNAFQSNFWGAQNGFATSNAAAFSNTASMYTSENAFATLFDNSNNASIGATHTSAPAPEITVDQDFGRTDLAIAGLNPFANISSATPSPSGAPEVRGAGTTPILGGGEVPLFGASFGEGGIEAEKTGEESDVFGGKDIKASPTQPAIPPVPTSGGIGTSLFPDFDTGFGMQADTTSAAIPRPVSPAVLSQQTPAMPSSGKMSADLFGDIGNDFGLSQSAPATSAVAPPAQVQPTPSVQPQIPPFGTFDFGMGPMAPAAPDLRTSATPSPSVSGVPSPARSVPAVSALDDLNATIRAAMSGSPSRNVSAAGTPSSASDGGRPDIGVSLNQPTPLLPSTSLPTTNVSPGLGLGSPAKTVRGAAMGTGFDAFGDILQPVSQSANPPTSQAGLGKTTASGKVITGDLDSSLASLAQNLDINRGAVSMQKGGHVWNSPKNTTKTGGANWTPQIASTTASWNSPQHAFKPMGGMQGSTANDGISADWAGGGAGSGIGGAFPKTGPAPKLDQQPLMAGPRPGMPPAGMMGMNVGIGMGTMGMPPAMSQQPLFNAMPARPAQPPAFNTPMPVGQPQQQSTTLDPFGAL